MGDFRVWLLKQQLSPKTATAYTRQLRSIQRYFEHRGWRLDRMTAEQLSEYAATKPRTWSTQKDIRSTVNHYWRFLGRRMVSPTWILRVPKKPKMICRALAEDEAQVYAGHAFRDLTKETVAMQLGLYLGARAFEIAGFRADWFAMAFHQATILGKGDKSRTIPVPAPLRRVILRAMASGVISGTGYLFPGRIDGHVHPATIRLWAKRFAQPHGFLQVNPHRLRHTCLATANDGTGDLRATQEFAGHASPETTQGYTRATWRRLERVAGAVDYGIVLNAEEAS